MRKFLFAAICLLPGVSWAGAQVNVDDDKSYFCEMQVTDAAVGAADGTSCNGVASGGLLQTAASGIARNANVPADRRLVIDSWGALVLATLAATEDCNLVLMTDTTPTGAGAAASTLTTGPGATETECTTGSNIVDAVGESCVINTQVAVPGGGFWRVEWQDNDGGGANTCTNWQSGVVWVRGRLLPQ